MSRRPNGKTFSVPEQFAQCPVTGTAMQFEVTKNGSMLASFFSPSGEQIIYEFDSAGQWEGSLCLLGKNRPAWPVSPEDLGNEDEIPRPVFDPLPPDVTGP